MARGISLHIGLNRVDPAHYDGWDGALTACEFDARDMKAIAESRGFTTRVLMTEEATADAVLNAISEAADELAAEMYDDIQRRVPGAEQADPQATVLLISGCRDDQLSLDGFSNGLFTENLRAVWNDGAWTGGYPEFRETIRARMPAKQQPNYYAVGAADPDFEQQKPFTIG